MIFKWYSQSWATISTIQVGNILITQKRKKPHIHSGHLPLSFPSPLTPQPWTNSNLLFVFIDLPVLHISYKYGLLWLTSFTDGALKSYVLYRIYDPLKISVCILITEFRVLVSLIKYVYMEVALLRQCYSKWRIILISSLKNSQIKDVHAR